MKFEINFVKSEERLPECDGTYVVWWDGIGLSTMYYTVEFGWNTHRNANGIVENPETSIEGTSIPCWLEINEKQFEEMMRK